MMFCGALEEFEPGPASSDDVTVVVGALCGVSTARLDRIWTIYVFNDIRLVITQTTPLGVGGGWMEDELRGRSVWSLDVCMELVKRLQV